MQELYHIHISYDCIRMSSAYKFFHKYHKGKLCFHLKFQFQLTIMLRKGGSQNAEANMYAAFLDQEMSHNACNIRQTKIVLHHLKFLHQSKLYGCLSMALHCPLKRYVVVRKN